MAEVETTNKREKISESNSTEDDLPQKILEKYSSDLQVQLIKGYRILQVLTYYLNNSPFFEKPENKKYGGRLYYDVIKHPMWFNEIKRKIFNAEYNSLVEIIKDMRLVFENCYYFWGPKTETSEQCVRMERLMEKQLLSLPKDLKNMCSLEETHGKNEDDFVTKIWNRLRHKSKGCSNLMLRTWRKRRINDTKEFEKKSDLKNQSDCKEKIEKWEKKVLRLEEHADFISTTIQLPQIGLFFHSVHELLDVEPYCQIEIERMLLIPRYSLALRQILTILLTDEHYGNPLPYEELMDKLKDTMNEWYSLYENKDRNGVEASQAICIEPEFFRIIGDTNPLLTRPYEDLDYREKAVIVKSLCDHFMSKRPNTEGKVTITDKAEFVAETIGRDKSGYSYLFFKEFLDFRLYKQRLAENVNVTNRESLHDVDNSKTTVKKISSKGSSNFEIVAESTEKLRCLIDELIYSDVETSKKDSKSSNCEIIDSLRELESRVIDNEDVFIKRSNDVRIKMFTQWKDMNQTDFFSKDDESNENNDDVCSNSPGSERFTKNLMSEVNFVDADHCMVSLNVDVADHPPDESNRFSPDSRNASNSELYGSAKENNEELTFETDIEDFQIKTEIKDEPPTDDILSSETILSGGRRRRSSVPSYNVFDKKLFFSDESESDSPEDIYTEGDDSDDDWDVPKKKSKRTKNKLTRQLKINAEDNNKRKKRNLRKNESITHVEKVSGAIEVKMESDFVVKKEEPVDIDKPSEEPQQKDGEKTKCGLKIKVVDLAKLQKSEDGVPTGNKPVEPAPLPRIVSQGTLQAVSRESMMSAVPVSSQALGMAKPFSSVRPSFTIVGQPQVFSNAYIIASDQSSFQPTATNQYRVQQFGSAVYRAPGMNIGRSPTQSPNRVLNPTNSSGRFLNSPLPSNRLVFVNQNSSLRFSSPTPLVQNAIKNPTNNVGKSNGISFNRITPLNKLVSVSGKSNYMYNATSKPGRNVAMTPNISPKTNERRNSFKEIEGSIGIHSNNGSLQYVVNLANGTHVPLTNIQVQKLREGNNGALPLKLKIPVPSDVAEKIEPCVVIDD